MAQKFKIYFKATIKKIKGASSMVWDEGEEEKFKRYLGTLQFKTVDTKVKVAVERYRNDASTQQMRYLWGVVYAILGEHFGYDIYEYEKEIHRPLKAMFLGYKTVEQRTTYKIFKEPVRTIDAQIVELVSTTDLDTKEMTDYIDNVRRWAQKEHNCYIPPPNDVDYDELPEIIPNF